MRLSRVRAGDLNSVAECNRCAGRLHRTFLALLALGRLGRRLQAEPERHAVRSDRRMLGLLVLRHAYDYAGSIPSRSRLRPAGEWVHGRLRQRARRDLGRVAHHAAAVGNWMQLQQAELWAPRYDLRWEDVYDGAMSPLPSREGYGQLGYVVARSMAVRDALAKGTPLDLDDVSGELRALLGRLVEIGAWPEAWKLARAMERHVDAALVDDAVRACGRRLGALPVPALDEGRARAVAGLNASAKRMASHGVSGVNGVFSCRSPGPLPVRRRLEAR